VAALGFRCSPPEGAVAGVLHSWLARRRLKKGVKRFADWLWQEPSATDVEWLASNVTGGDVDRAAWELRYARRALGLLVAERDSLDDRTASLVAQEIAARTKLDRNVAPSLVGLAERQFDQRLKSYRDVVLGVPASRLTAEPLAKAFAEIVVPGMELPANVSGRLGAILLAYVVGANETLRAAVGPAALPDDLPPSALAQRWS
jgi:hypothetical protein